jgi:hypothetical protein
VEKRKLPDLGVMKDAGQQIAQLADLINDPLTNGFTACTCKQHLYLLKCLLEDIYKDLPDFPHQEEEWEKTRLMEILKNE